MKIDDISWNYEGAFLVHGDHSEEEVRAAIVAHNGDGDYQIGPVEWWRKRPSRGEFDTVIEKNTGENTRGAFLARLVQ